MGGYREDRVKHFSEAQNERMRNNRHQLHRAKFWLSIKNQSFTRTVMHWNELTKAAVEHPSSESKLNWKWLWATNIEVSPAPSKGYRQICPESFASPGYSVTVTPLHKYEAGEFHQVFGEGSGSWFLKFVFCLVGFGGYLFLLLFCGMGFFVSNSFKNEKFTLQLLSLS